MTDNIGAPHAHRPRQIHGELRIGVLARLCDRHLQLAHHGFQTLVAHGLHDVGALREAASNWRDYSEDKAPSSEFSLAVHKARHGGIPRAEK